MMTVGGSNRNKIAIKGLLLELLLLLMHIHIYLIREVMLLNICMGCKSASRESCSKTRLNSLQILMSCTNSTFLVIHYHMYTLLLYVFMSLPVLIAILCILLICICMQVSTFSYGNQIGPVT
jgi:hypothetical protein